MHQKSHAFPHFLDCILITPLRNNLILLLRFLNLCPTWKEFKMTDHEIETIEAKSKTTIPKGFGKKSSAFWMLLLANGLALSVGATAGPLLLRFYFVHGGSRRWLSAWLETGGWPILILPLWISYGKRSNQGSNHVSPKLFIICCGVGILTGLDDYMYAWGVSYLPVSTYILLTSTHLAFTAVFAFLLVRQKFSPFSINSVLLLTSASVLLSFHTKSDRPEGVTNGQYGLGFVLIIGAAALYGLILPVIELMYRTTACRLTYTLAMEMQLIMSASATAFCTVGMLANRDFQAIHGEAKAFRLGEVNYYMAIVWGAVAWQLFFIGISGVIFLTSSLLSGIIVTVLIPVTEVLGVIVFHEKFSGEKAMAMLLAFWGFTSYLYGEYRYSKRTVTNKERQPSFPKNNIRRPLGESANTELEVIVEENPVGDLVTGS